MTATASAYTRELEVSAAAQKLAAQIERSVPEPDALICFFSARHDHAALSAELSRRYPAAVLVGCSSAGEFSSEYQGEGSASIFAISSQDMVFTSSLATGISNRPAEAARNLLSRFRGFSDGRFVHRSALILNDALAGSADELVRMLNVQTGGKYKFFGGGAGDDAAFSRTYVFNGTRVETNAAVALEILSRKPLGVGVRHGWAPATEPLRVTSSTGAVVGSLNAIAAADVFSHHAEATGQQLDRQAPLSFFLHNIAGMRLPEGYKLRVPLGIGASGEVSFAAEVPEGVAVSIMTATAESSTEAAREATQDAVSQLAGAKPAGALMFDCVATRLRLGQAFGEEVQAVREAVGDVPMAGCNTYGQVASAEGQFTGFHNCTAVICVFPE
ncbi:MAG: FIST N-terminal domain-containing protein [Acidobacteriaceae bacterium]